MGIHEQSCSHSFMDPSVLVPLSCHRDPGRPCLVYNLTWAWPTSTFSIRSSLYLPYTFPYPPNKSPHPHAANTLPLFSQHIYVLSVFIHLISLSSILLWDAVFPTNKSVSRSDYSISKHSSRLHVTTFSIPRTSFHPNSATSATLCYLQSSPPLFWPPRLWSRMPTQPLLSRSH